VRQAIKALHASDWQGVFVATGGGATLIAKLLAVPGASATVLEATIPYSHASLAGLLGGTPDQAASDATARALAMHAWSRARALGAHRPFGFACTASLATNRVKRGTHRAHFALQTDTDTFRAGLRLAGGRAAEEAEVATSGIRLIAHALGIPAAGECTLEVERTLGRPGWIDLLAGRTDATATAAHDGGLIFPGSYNPLHDGHRQMLAFAEARTGLAGAYELSIENPDKPMLDFRSIEERIARFDRPAWLTRLPTFAGKAGRFPGATFVVGSDTVARIAEPRYYGSIAARDRALGEMHDCGVRLLVFGRVDKGVFRDLDSLRLPEALRALCDGVAEAEFRIDISSSDLRARTATESP
jgi:nicotinamide mononucleotide (NMN) deamidase PncC